MVLYFLYLQPFQVIGFTAGFWGTYAYYKIIKEAINEKKQKEN